MLLRTREDVERFVLGHVVDRGEPDYQSRLERLKPVIDRMVEHDECLLHASAVVNGTQCFCANCYDLKSRRTK